VLNELLSTIFQGIVIYILIKFLIAIVQRQTESKLALRKELQEKFDQFIHNVKEEQHGDQYYWFDKDSDIFLAQGKSISEIIERLKHSHSRHVFIINDEEVICAPDWVPKK
jgi:hypothetical protein